MNLAPNIFLNEQVNFMKILVFGLPGSGKSTLANKLAQKIGADLFNADEVREEFQDWDFSVEGRIRQARRMLQLADSGKNQYKILDFVCPLIEMRKIIDPDLTIFIDTIVKGRFEDTNLLFERPASFERIHYHVKQRNADEISHKISSELITFDWKKPTVQMLGRWQPFHDGHAALFQRALSKTGQVIIQVRDCQGWQDSNPFNFSDIKACIIKKLNLCGYFEGRDFIIQKVPNITNITYGRNVGYTIDEERFSPEITEISATQIRREMGLK